MAWPTERDLEVLRELSAACDAFAHMTPVRGYVRPMDCGGTDGSDHSYRLAKLAKRGLAEFWTSKYMTRGSRHYRITDAGRALIAH